MAVPPTVTVRVRDLLRHAQERAVRTERTQQLELSDNLFVRVAPGGSRFLLFCVEGEPQRAEAEAVALALGYHNPRYGWHQGQTLRSLTVEDGAPAPPAAGTDQE